MRMKLIALLLAIGSFLAQSPSVYAQQTNAQRTVWVDSVFSTLNQEEKIGQLFMIAAYSGGKNYNEALVSKLLQKNQIGGLIFMQGGAGRQAILTNKYQSQSKVPLLIGMDAEWGLGMRLDSITNFPRQMMLGATQDTALMYEIGAAVAAQCKRLGVHINFAPVVDINNNPNNPVINFRSFGENKYNVVRMAIAYMKGMQDKGIMACAKHFPGHGDTDADSHKELPEINKTLAQLDTLEFYPFRELARAGVQSMMVAHLQIPALEQQKNTPTTLSKNTVTNLLKNKMGFKGLVFTDALNMDGVAKYYPPGEVDVKAFIAGNDVLLFSQDVPTAISKMKAAIASGTVKESEIEERVKKILAAKYDAGLAQFKPVSTQNINEDINAAVNTLKEKTAAAAVTLVKVDNNLLGKITSGNLRIQFVGVNTTTSEIYNQLQNAKKNVAVSWLPKGSTEAEVKRIISAAAQTDVTIVALQNMNLYPSGNYGYDVQQMNFLKAMQSKNNVLFVVMGNPYILKNFCDVKSAVVAYESDAITQTVVGRMLLGKLPIKGKLPVTPCPAFSKAAGTETGSTETIKPNPQSPTGSSQKFNDMLRKVNFVEDAGVTNPKALDKIGPFIQRCIVEGAFPGCRVLAAKDGKIFYDESFGYLNYEKKNAVNAATLYDIASVTKVAATTLAVMKLYDEGKINLNKTIGDYLPEYKFNDKGFLALKDVLMHQAGLKSWIPFYKETLDSNGELSKYYYNNAATLTYNIPVAKNLFAHRSIKDTIWNRIINSPLENIGKYVYSDLDYYFLAAIVERITQKKIDRYLSEAFYAPMGLQNTLFNPFATKATEQIAPTEYDLNFRQQLVQGYVHDPGAAMMGGVEGHAGLFATAYDIGVIFQLLLNKGTYRGKRYLNAKTVELFTAYSSRISRRGLGFDKPNADAANAGPTSNRCSGSTFGHQGFTGTCAWADAEHGIIYIFLSNRVHPSADNTQINRLDVRNTVQDYIYESFGIIPNRDRAKVRASDLAMAK